jgi:AraC family transcriptional regulator
MNAVVERAVACIWERYSEPLSLSDIARSALLSRFHFSRVFKETTGISPGQFLAAVRIHQAKRMLLATPMSVAEIAGAVGYNSLGSFTQHFTDSVGISPSRFRRNHGTGCVVPHRDPLSRDGEITGTVNLPRGYDSALVYLGVFDTPIVQHRPQAAGLLEVSSSLPFAYRLAKVPCGTWFVHAVAVADSDEPQPWNHRGSLVATAGPLSVSPGAPTLATVALRPRQAADVPVLLALPDLDGEAESLVLPELDGYQRIWGVGG